MGVYTVDKNHQQTLGYTSGGEGDVNFDLWELDLVRTNLGRGDSLESSLVSLGSLLASGAGVPLVLHLAREPQSRLERQPRRMLSSPKAS